MSFSSQTKEELLRTPFDRECCLLSEVAALTQTSGSLGFLGGGHFSVTYQVEHAGTARRLFRMLKEGMKLSPKLHVVEHRRLGVRRTCVLTVEEEDAWKLLESLDMMKTEENGNRVLKHTHPHPQLNKQCCRKAYLRGCFLGAGSMTSPEKNYQMEWITQNESQAQALEKVLEKSDIHPSKKKRRDRTVLYLKSAQSIVDVLAMMGASQAVMDMENVRITRQIRGNVNRAANCDLHNTEKSMNASENQIRAINRIVESKGMDSLSPVLQELARIRLENPHLSLEELGPLLNPPVGKSGVNHRMRRIMAIAQSL